MLLISDVSVHLTYPENICFTCSKCGLCCGNTPQKTRHVLLLKPEADQIAAQTGKRISEFAVETLEKEPYVFEMRKNAETGMCIFLKNNQCTIYDTRPLICRFYPFELTTSENGEPVFGVTFECPGVACLGTPKGGGKLLGERYFRALLRLARDRHKQPCYSHE